MDMKGLGRKNLEELKTQTVKLKKIKLEAPNSQFLQHHFISTGVDKLRAAGGKQTGLENLDELTMRSFLYTVLLGQCLKYSRKVAAETFQKVFMKSLDFIAGNEFFSTGAQILEALKKFNALESQVKKREDNDNGALIFKRYEAMFTQEAFEHMYAGVVAYMMMPVLYSSVLATLHEQNNNYKVTGRYYRNNYERSMSMLGDYSGPWWQGSVKKGYDLML